MGKKITNPIIELKVPIDRNSSNKSGIPGIKQVTYPVMVRHNPKINNNVSFPGKILGKMDVVVKKRPPTNIWRPTIPPRYKEGFFVGFSKRRILIMNDIRLNERRKLTPGEKFLPDNFIYSLVY